ncbi:MAG: chemotaxis response regulator CheY [Proteobacteria bacterium]|nr:chemotaxis response regulator CheY [Pseudomonadota bacterium]
MAVSRPDMKILVVDDFPTMRRIVKTLLRQNGYTNFVEAEDGAQGLKMLGEQSDIEFIVSDWNMPNMTGLEFLKAVRADARYKHLPFLMVTAEAEKENIIEAVKSGVSNYVVKPFTGQTLQEKLAKVFAPAKRAG